MSSPLCCPLQSPQGGVLERPNWVRSSKGVYAGALYLWYKDPMIAPPCTLSIVAPNDMARN